MLSIRQNEIIFNATMLKFENFGIYDKKYCCVQIRLSVFVDHWLISIGRLTTPQKGLDLLASCIQQPIESRDSSTNDINIRWIFSVDSFGSGWSTDRQSATFTTTRCLFHVDLRNFGIMDDSL